MSLWRRYVQWLGHRERNDAIVDVWSFVHMATGALMAWVMDPYLALTIMVLWEPLEILVLSPIIDRIWGIRFGYETLRNSMSDILFDAVGVALGHFIVKAAYSPPFMIG